MQEATCMHFSTNLQSSKTIQWMDSSMDGYSWNPNLFDGFICQLVNTTSTFIGPAMKQNMKIINAYNYNPLHYECIAQVKKQRNQILNFLTVFGNIIIWTSVH